nr:hypothetical protein RVX_0356 [Nitratidesulfovibrio sp. HK-II]
MRRFSRRWRRPLLFAGGVMDVGSVHWRHVGSVVVWRAKEAA